ncbi:MAG: DinB family protein [Chitinophagaceae bacterium]
MGKQDLFITMALASWESNIKRTNAVFDSFTDEELQQPVAPGKNRIIYLLGHLAAEHDMLLPLLGLGEQQYAYLNGPFISSPDGTVKDLPSAKELRAAWTTANETLRKHFNALSTEEWFMKHTRVSEEDFAKEPHRNRLNVLLSRTNHVSYHLGQLILVKPGSKD